MNNCAMDVVGDYFPMVELVDMVDSSPPLSGNGAFLDENDARFFEAVEEGRLELVQSMLNDRNRQININVINARGLTALQIAVKNKRQDVAKELLEHGSDLKKALLQAVFHNNVEQIELLLSIEIPDTAKAKRSDTYTSPLIVAAQLGNYESLHLLLRHDRCIEIPHEYKCVCDECEAMPDMLRSKITLNAFRGLSSPEYMCLQYIMGKCGNKDPLTQAFELNVMLEKRAKDEPELKKEYLKLSKRCTRFSVEIYNECNSMEEITAVLDIDETHFDLKRQSKVKKQGRLEITKTFRRIINSCDKEFVAHPNTQQLLNFVVYSGFREWTRISYISQFFLFLLYTFTFPIFACTYIFLPQHRISKTMRTPIVKFLSHTSQFIVFLVLLAASALRNNHVPNILEYLVLIFVVGMIVQECYECLSVRPRRSYFFKWWNITTTVMLILFLLAFLLWLLGFAITGGWSVVEYSKVTFKTNTGHRLLLVGNSLFSLGIVVSVFHLVDLCQVSSVIGPLQLSLYRMLRDVLKFLLIFFAIFMAFVMGIRNLYSYYNSVIDEISKHNQTLVTKDHPLSTFSQSTLSMFWALFDKIDLDDFNTDGGDSFSITQETGKILFAFYSICAVMVALNMLIGMMSHSYENISQDDDIQWKYSRTQLWLEFIAKGSTLPSPYNLIPNPGLIYRVMKKKCLSDSTTDSENRRTREAKRRRIIKNLVRRYFGKQELQKKKEFCTVKDMENCRTEILECLKTRNLSTP